MCVFLGLRRREDYGQILDELNEWCKAGVADAVRVVQADAAAFYAPEARGTLVTNPPYGVRLGDAEEAAELMHDFGRVLKPALASGWQAGILTADAEIERELGLKATARRKLYNGMLKCELYTFGGKRETAK